MERTLGRLNANSVACPTEELDLLRVVLEQQGLLVWSAGSDGFVDYVSESFFRFCGLTRAEVIGPGCRVLMPEAEHPSGAERWRKATALGEGYRARVTFRGADGGFTPHVIRLTPLSMAGGGTRWVGSARRVLPPKEEAEPNYLRIVSPLSGTIAGAAACGPMNAPRSWWHVQEADGTRYVASARWLRAAKALSPSETDRKQIYWAAQHYAGQGIALSIVAPFDVDDYDHHGPCLPTTPWLVER